MLEQKFSHHSFYFSLLFQTPDLDPYAGREYVITCFSTMYYMYNSAMDNFNQILEQFCVNSSDVFLSDGFLEKFQNNWHRICSWKVCVLCSVCQLFLTSNVYSNIYLWCPITFLSVFRGHIWKFFNQTKWGIARRLFSVAEVKICNVLIVSKFRPSWDIFVD